MMLVNHIRVSKWSVLAALTCVLCLTQTGSATADDEKRLSFSSPTSPWMLTLPAGDFEVAEKKFKPDGSGAYFYLISDKTKLNVSFFIEPVSNCKTSKECRDLVWKGGNPAWKDIKNVVQSEIGDISFFEFMLPSFDGLPVKQQNMYAEFVVDGYWVDLHISKALYKPEDHKLFEDLVKSIKFEPKEKNTSDQEF